MKAPHTNILVRMSPELKEKLQGEAVLRQRSLTQEINERLRNSFGPKHGPTLQAILAREQTAKALASSAAYPISSATAHAANNVDAGHEKSPAAALTDIDRAMLAVFRALPVEKQLALLSLFR